MTDTATQSVVHPDALPSRVAIVEDHDLLAQSLALALTRVGVDVVTVRDLRAEAVVGELARHEIDLVLLDFDLGDAGTGLDLIGQIAALGLRVVMLTGETDPLVLARCVEAGAVGLLSKAQPFDELVEYVSDVVAGRSMLSITTRERLLSGLRAHRLEHSERTAPFQRLTTRESEVLQDLIEGKNAERIAADSFVSVATVRSHIKALLAKLGVNSQLAAVAMARRAGWSAPEQKRRPA
ncbi:MAG: response regulator [Acidimicrobiia bacterium]